MAVGSYAQNVFINCPFDSDYAALFDATAFSDRGVFTQRRFAPVSDL